MIAHMMRGEAGHTLKSLSGEIADVFGLKKPIERIDPHLTLKAPFEASDQSIQRLTDIIATFCAQNRKVELEFEGIGHFSRRVVYVDAKANQEVQKLLGNLIFDLKKCNWLTFENSDFEKKLHATLAYADDRRTFEEIMKYLADEKIHFNHSFDSISILRREKDRWRLHEEFMLEP
jgi:2'-5' RNA ligase